MRRFALREVRKAKEGQTRVSGLCRHSGQPLCGCGTREEAFLGGVSWRGLGNERIWLAAAGQLRTKNLEISQTTSTLAGKASSSCGASLWPEQNEKEKEKGRNVLTGARLEARDVMSSLVDAEPGRLQQSALHPEGEWAGTDSK